MCDQCGILDRKIEHYKLLLLAINDKTMADGLTDLIERHESAKRALHAAPQAMPPQ
jgi:hypothetical protein